MPMRIWRNSTGPRESSLMASATSASTGATSSSAPPASTTSIARLIASCGRSRRNGCRCRNDPVGAPAHLDLRGGHALEHVRLHFDAGSQPHAFSDQPFEPRDRERAGDHHGVAANSGQRLAQRPDPAHERYPRAETARSRLVVRGHAPDDAQVRPAHRAALGQRGGICIGTHDEHSPLQDPSPVGDAEQRVDDQPPQPDIAKDQRRRVDVGGLVRQRRDASEEPRLDPAEECRDGNAARDAQELSARTPAAIRPDHAQGKRLDAEHHGQERNLVRHGAEAAVRDHRPGVERGIDAGETGAACR